jgi:hypothetical protein
MACGRLGSTTFHVALILTWDGAGGDRNFDVPSNHVTKILLIAFNALSMPRFNLVSHLRHRAASEVPNSLATANYHAIRPQYHNAMAGISKHGAGSSCKLIGLPEPCGQMYYSCFSLYYQRNMLCWSTWTQPKT